ncbi:hypothetical protein U1Q18_033031 [Sarracenia purpurea var. burkii]
MAVLEARIRKMKGISPIKQKTTGLGKVKSKTDDICPPKAVSSPAAKVSLGFVSAGSQPGKVEVKQGTFVDPNLMPKVFEASKPGEDAPVITSYVLGEGKVPLSDGVSEVSSQTEDSVEEDVEEDEERAEGEENKVEDA